MDPIHYQCVQLDIIYFVSIHPKQSTCGSLSECSTISGAYLITWEVGSIPYLPIVLDQLGMQSEIITFIAPIYVIMQKRINNAVCSFVPCSHGMWYPLYFSHRM